MKLASLFLALLAGIWHADLLHAQHYIGLVGGVNFANLSIDLEPPDDEFDQLTRFALGCVAGLQLQRNFTLHFEPTYVRKGGKQSDFSRDFGSVEFRYKSSSLEIPVLLKAAIPANRVSPYLLAGPTFGFILDTNLEVDAATLRFKGDADQIARSAEVGLSFGGGADIAVGRHKIFLQGRYTFGLTNINRGGDVTVQAGSAAETIAIDATKVKTKDLRLMTGLSFAL